MGFIFSAGGVWFDKNRIIGVEQCSYKVACTLPYMLGGGTVGAVRSTFCPIYPAIEPYQIGGSIQ